METHKCPNCSASLPLAEPGAVMRCQFCGSEHRVPQRAPHPLAGGMPRIPQVAAKAGCASAAIGVVVALAVAGGGIAMYVAHRVDARSDSAPAAAQAAATANAAEELRAQAEEMRATLRAQAEERRAAKRARAAEAQTSQPRPSRPPAPPARSEPPAPPARSEFQTLRGCLCRTDVDRAAGEETIQLAVNVGGASTTITGSGVITSRRFDWYVDVGSKTSFLLPVGDDTAPPARALGGAFGVGLACDGDVLAVASQNFVTGWSLSERKRLWSTQLGGVYPRGSGTPEGLAINCGTIKVKKGVIRVPVDGGPALRVRLKDGSVP